MHTRLNDHSLYAFAGIWSWGGDDVGPTCAIITCAPNEVVATIHDRMPVILTRQGKQLWLDPEELMCLAAHQGR